MKNFTINTRFVLLVMGLVLFLLPISAQTSWQTAVPLAKNEQKRGELSSYVKENWYKITITQNTKARFGFKTDVKAKDQLSINYLRLYNENGTTVEQRNSEACYNTADTLTVFDLAAGTYYLQIDRYGGYGGYTLSYTEEYPSVGNDSEPNDNFSTTSTLLKPGVEVTGHLGYFYKRDGSDRDTKDFYIIKIERNTKARFGFKSYERLSINYLRLYNEIGNTIELRNSEACYNTADTLTVVDLAAGTYYLQIDRYGGEGGYTLSYTEEYPSMNNDTEPNDAYNQTGVRTLPNEQPLTGHLGYFYKRDASDRDKDDWYKVVVAKNGAGSFKFETDKILSINYLRLYSLKDGVLKERNSKACYNTIDELIVPNLEAGTYYLRIDYYGGQGAYKLTYKAINNPLQNDTEPNNKYNDSGVVTLFNGQPATGQLGYTIEGTSDIDNSDFYKVIISTNTKARFGFKTDGTLSINYLRLYNEIGDTIEQRNSEACYNIADTLTVFDLAAGTYYLQIDRYGGQGGYTLSYTEEYPSVGNDSEPNDNFSTTSTILKPGVEVTGHLGYFYKQDGSDRDTKDFYIVKIERNTKARFGFKSHERLSINYLRLYNEIGDTIEQRNSEACYNIADTLTVVDLAAGTYYLQIDRYGGEGGYTLSYTEEYPSVGDDIEPNDNFRTTSTTLKADEKVTGHLGYFYKRDGSDRDTKDFYTVKIERNTKARFGFKSHEGLSINYLRLYNQIGDTIEQRNSEACYNIADTLTVVDLAAGTYYLQIDRYGGQGGYTLSYMEEYPSKKDDIEPNDNFKNATVTLTSGDTVTGHLGYYYKRGASDRDTKDWYKVKIDKKQTAKFGFISDNTLSVNCLRLYNAIGDTIEHRNSEACYNSADTLIVNNLEPGNYYLQIDYYGGQGAYTLGLNSFPHPQVAFEAIRNMNTYSFVNNTEFGATYSWDFGDGKKSGLANPFHTYAEPGVYEVALESTNEYGKTTLTKQVEVRGLQRVESAVGGAGGSTTVSIYGGGLRDNSTAYLRATGGAEIAATYNNLDNIGEFRATFDLTNASEGKYDVIVRTTGEDDMVLKEGFTVEPRRAAEMWAEINGRDRALIGRWQSYTLEYGNKGNVDTESRIIWLVTPHTPAEVEFKNVIIDDVDFYPEEVRQRLSDPDMPTYLLYDMEVNGEIQKVRLYSLMIPVVKANSHEKIEFRVKSEIPFEVSTFITESFVDENPNASPNPNAVRMLAPAKYKNFTECSQAAMLSFAGDKMLGVVTDLIPFGGCATDIYKGVTGTYKDVKGGKFSWGNFGWTVITSAWSCTKDAVPALQAYKYATMMVDAVVDFGNNAINMAECQKYKKKKEKKKKVRTVYSFDPNEMIGPSGYGNDNFITKQVMPYTILFENMKTATAPAQEVVILDTLDIEKFDMSTFRFVEYGYGNNRYTAIQDGNSFVNNIDLRPEKDVIVRVSGVLNPENGIVRWQFITLDPETMDLTEDPDAGFLPPNVTRPEGEGFVSFLVAPKSHIKTGDILSNQANIFFDLNKPIATNIWTNIIDEKAPTSRVISARPIELADTTGVEFEFESTDGTGVGTKSYDLYVSLDNGEFEHKFSNIPVGEKVRLPLEKGSYKFYTIATDSVGNREATKTAPEISVVVTSVEEILATQDQLLIQPNPASDYVIIKNVSEGSLVKVYDITGCLVMTEIVTGECRLDVSNLPSGIYLLEADRRQGKLIIK